MFETKKIYIFFNVHKLFLGIESLEKILTNKKRRTDMARMTKFMHTGTYSNNANIDIKCILVTNLVKVYRLLLI